MSAMPATPPMAPAPKAPKPAKPRIAAQEMEPRMFVSETAIKEFFDTDPRVSFRFNDPLGVSFKVLRATPTQELAERLSAMIEKALVDLAHAGAARVESALAQAERGSDFKENLEAAADALVLQ